MGPPTDRIQALEDTVLIPVGTDIRLAVEILLPTVDGIPSGAGWLVRRDGDLLRIELPDPLPLTADARVILTGACFGDCRVLGRVEAVEGGVVVVRHQLSRRPDARRSPRVEGELDLRYRLLRDEPDQPWRWVEEGHSVAEADAWRTPEPRMDFSLAGLRFTDPGHACAPGARLLVEIGVPPAAARHRCSARVVRLHPGDGVAVELLDVPEDLEDALVDEVIARR